MFKFLSTRKAPKETLRVEVREDWIGNNRVPAKATRDKIFNKVKEFMKGERKGLKGFWTEFKSDLLSLPTILEIWLPGPHPWVVHNYHKPTDS
jgi:hypothetical protein